MVETPDKKILDTLTSLHSRIAQHPAAKRFTLLNRVLLACAFIPTGLVKIAGQPFTMIGPDNPVGRFFSVFYENQLWYQAVGWVQFIAGVLLLIPRAAHLGAFLFLPIIVNIHLVTTGIGFKGTPVVTGLMVLANLWLIVWEFPRWKTWFTSMSHEIPYKSLSRLERYGLMIGLSGMLGALLGARGIDFERIWPEFGWISGVGAVIGVMWGIRRLRGERK